MATGAYSLVAICRLLIAVASLCCGARARGTQGGSGHTGRLGAHSEARGTQGGSGHTGRLGTHRL